LWGDITIEEASRIGMPWDEPDTSSYKEIFDDGLAAFNFISELSRGAHFSEFGSRIYYDYNKRHDGIVFEFETRSGFKQVRELFESPWWSRIWVIQETILPPEAVMVYGSISASWQMFLGASKAIDTHTRGCCSSMVRTMIGQHRFTLRKIRALIQELEASR
jgi:hypothetical protein